MSRHYGWDSLPLYSQALYKSTYFLPGEDFSQWLVRVSTAYQNNVEHGQRMASYINKQWFHPSTPPSSNAGTDRGLPISCFTGHVSDTKKGIFSSFNESNWLGAFGGGLGWDWSDVREVNHSVGIHGGKSSGVIPFFGVSDRSTLAVSQGGLRRASQAVYLRIDHPEILEFIDLRKPTGDQNRRSPNLHHGVVITDAFMNAVIADDDWKLISPKNGETVQEVKAKDLWIQILEVRATLKGEPFMLFTDTVNDMSPQEYKNANIKVSTSNLCVTGDTKILTKDGYKEISTLEDQTVECWNGSEWSKTPIMKTNTNASVLKVVLDNYSEIEATPYHKWYIMEGYSKIVEKRTQDLVPGDKLVKFDLEPVTHGTKELSLAYVNGFHSGDGTVYKDSNAARISLHDGKQTLIGRFSNYHSTSYSKEGRILNLMFKHGVLRDKFFIPNSTFSVQSRLDWLAGYLDADGTLTNNNDTESIQVVSIELNFLQELLLLLQELGIHSTISKAQDAGYKKLPANDGTGELKEFWCKPTYRLLISGSELPKLLNLGYRASRVQPTMRHYQRQARQFVKVVSVSDECKLVDTYCGTEPLKHKLMFNGVLTGNCTEITLRTDDKYSGVCCLGSINVEHWDEFVPELAQFVADCSDYLDNILTDFINRTEGLEGFERARAGAIDERSIGLGVMGYHSYLQSNMIPFDSPMAIGANNRIFKLIAEAADLHNRQEGEHNPSPLAKRTGIKKRNTHVTSVAPTMSISGLARVCSSGIEPWVANAFTKKVQQGSFPIRNKYLEKYLLDRMDKDGKPVTLDWVEEQWVSIKKAQGSVQHLEWMPNLVKDVFKTAFEIDQFHIIKQAGDRQPYIDQAQSLNIFIPGGSNVQWISDLHMYGWRARVKSFYYLRSSAISKASTSGEGRKAIGTKADQETTLDELTSDSCIGCG